MVSATLYKDLHCSVWLLKLSVQLILLDGPVFLCLLVSCLRLSLSDLYCTIHYQELGLLGQTNLCRGSFQYPILIGMVCLMTPVTSHKRNKWSASAYYLCICYVLLCLGKQSRTTDTSARIWS